MSTRFKIILVLWLLALAIVIVLVVDPSLVSKNNYRINNATNMDKDARSAKMEEEYRNQIKIEYEKIYAYLSQSQPSVEYLDSVRTRILNLRVPTKYRDLHLSLVLAIDRMENFEKLGKISDKNEGENIINRLKNENKWL